MFFFPDSDGKPDEVSRATISYYDDAGNFWDSIPVKADSEELKKLQSLTTKDKLRIKGIGCLFISSIISKRTVVDKASIVTLKLHCYWVDESLPY